ncbi:MAG: ferredoxin [Verrucomicrobiota bacterium]|nr:ferredoxin [Verrucomicrobiota bacterium]
MANYQDRFEQNVTGGYYVDRTCVHCKLCMSIAPDHFTQQGFAGFVIQQPSTDREEALCEVAMDSCPVNAIGDDGNKKG